MANQPAPTGEAEARFLRFWQSLWVVLIGLLFVAATTALLLLPALTQSRPYSLRVGDIAPEDIRAPRDVSYVSRIETQEAREAAALAVADIFDPPDARLGRQQVRRARQIMTFVRDVRADLYADDELRRGYVGAITALSLSPEQVGTLLGLSETQFEQVEREVVALIEDAMSGTVKEGQVGDVTGRLELRVSSEMPEDLIPLTIAIAADLIVPNSALNVTATENARAAARDAVSDITVTYQRNEIVVRGGERVDPLVLEALTELGLATQRITWETAASALLVSLLSGVLLSVYLVMFDRRWVEDGMRLLLLTVLFVIFLAIGQVMLPGHTTAAYLFPSSGLVLVLTALVGAPYAALSAVVLALLSGYLAGGSLEIVLYTVLSGLMAAAALRRATRLNGFFVAGVAAAAAGAAALLIFHLPGQLEPPRLAQLMLLALINGLLSAGVALVTLFVVGSLTGITTSLRLLDLMRIDHPLQRMVQQEALGTYQHTLSVANLAEAAAEAIGADTLLVRVGTLFHDIGKANNPGFFVENRAEGQPDPHEGLSPLASARIIKAHVTDGVELARRHRLPPRIIDFIREHHGTLPIIFFLHRAREEAREAGLALDESQYCYDGPTPRSPETALLMMADGCESAVRASRPATAQEIEEIVTRIIQQRLDLNQFDDSGMTLTQIKLAKEAFVRTLQGMYHPRVRYPDQQPRELEAGRRAAPLTAGAAALAEVDEPLDVSPAAASGEEEEPPSGGAAGRSTHDDGR